MPNKFGRVNETDVACATMRYLSTIPSREASIDEIVAALPGFLALGSADRAQSQTRRNEELWEQQVRNIVSHKLSPGNAIHDGLLEHRPPARLYLTDAGLAQLNAVTA